MIQNNNELPSCSPYIEQPSNFNTVKSNNESNSKTTSSLKALALQVLGRNQQSNFNATDMVKKSNFQSKGAELHSCASYGEQPSNLQNLNDFILKTYKVDILQVKRFLGSYWEDYSNNLVALIIWAEMLSQKGNGHRM